MFIVIIHGGRDPRGPFNSQEEAIAWAKQATKNQVIYGRWDVRPIVSP